MEYQTRNTRIHVVVCPESRCKKCPSNTSLSYCEQLSIGSSDLIRVLLIEPSRNLVHLSGHIVDSYLDLPWNSEMWETVYIDSVDILKSDVDSIIEAYSSGPYLSLFIKNYEKDLLLYHAFPLVKSSLEYSLLQNLKQVSLLNLSKKIPTRLSLHDRISIISKSVSKYIAESIPEIDTKTRKNLAQITSHQSTVLNQLFPLFLDDEIEEIYLDAPNTSIYFDHRRMGRVETTWKPTNADLTRMVTLLRSESNLHLDRRNPSLKTDLMLYDTPLRFSVSLPPLASEGIHLEIRRAKTHPFTILDLIRNNTLDVYAAAILVLAINLRMNITITGKPGVGKTTLMNALDNITPKKWRKIYIEDTVESRLYDGHHQVRVRVDPVDEVDASFDKVTEIVKSLHRSPDYLILGEIQTEEHSKALFQSIAAGLHSIQTCHSTSPHSLITRWSKNHGIHDSSIALMDLIVSLRRPQPGESKRYVNEIVEIRRKLDSGIIEFVGLNTLYNKLDTELSNSWTKDGSFEMVAQEQGIGNYIPAFNKIVDGLKKGIADNRVNVSDIVDSLWKNGHPMIINRT